MSSVDSVYWLVVIVWEIRLTTASIVNRWTVLATAFFILFFSGGTRFAFGLILRPMSEDLGLNRSELSLTVTVFMMVSAFALPIFGRLVDRHRVRGVLAGGVVASATGIVATGGATNLWQIFVFYGILYGVGNAAASTATVGVLVARWFSERTGLANSVAISGNAIGQLLIIATLAFVITFAGWRHSLFWVGITNVLLVLPMLIFGTRSSPFKTEGDHENTTHKNVRGTITVQVPDIDTGLFVNRRLLLLIVMYSICGFQDFFVAIHLVAFATDQGVGGFLAGNILALMGVMGLVGVLASGLVADALGTVRPALVCFLTRTVMFALILCSWNTYAIIIFALGYGFTFLVTAPLMVIFVRDMFGTKRLGLITGILLMTHQGFGGLGALTGGLSFDLWDTYSPAFLLMLVLSVLATSATLLIPMISRRRVATG